MWFALAFWMSSSFAWSAPPAGAVPGVSVPSPTPSRSADDDDRVAGGAQQFLNSDQNRMPKPQETSDLNSGAEAYKKARDTLNKIRNPSVSIPFSE
jgi:hypothetical protein